MGVPYDGLLQIGDADGLGRAEQGQLLYLLARGQQVALKGVTHEVDRIRQRLEAEALKPRTHPAREETGLGVIDRHIGAALAQLVEPGCLHLGLIETPPREHQQQVGMQLLADLGDAGGQVLVDLGGQLQLDDLAGREETHGLTGVIDLIPVQPGFHHEAVALIKPLFAGHLTHGVYGLELEQRLVTKNEIAGLEPCLEMVRKLLGVDPHQHLPWLSWCSADCFGQTRIRT
ncbi:hypothetical protein D3C78_760050 [compost metagenome]